ncbi:MAG TPA: glycosyltransferase family 4 protein [Atribacterota bacterium]|nr:glycosyltransferase family 4 protein [Atribacterota bacterium]
MKILVINDTGVEYGGVSTYIGLIRGELGKKNHTVKILSSDVYYGKEHFSDYEFGGEKNRDTIKWFFNKLFNFKSYFKTKEVLKDFKPDIVHLNYIDNQVSPSVLACLRDIPVVMTLHDYSLFCPMGRMLPSQEICEKNFGEHCIRCIGSIKGYYYEKIKQKVYRILLNNIDSFIAPSKNIKKNFKKQNFINSEIITIPNGIVLFKYNEVKDTKKILYVGRLSKEKGVEYLLNAIPLILKKQPKVICDIVGDGPERERLERHAKNLKLSKNVKFRGKIAYEKIEEYYRKSTVVVIPSICPEAFSLVGVEAMSVGRVVVGTNVGAIPEWLEDGRTGFLVEPKNSKDIANKIIKLFKDQNLLKVMGKRAHIKSAHFSIEEHINNLEKVYKRVLKKYIEI